MASNDVIKAQRYSEEAKVAAATAKLYSQGNSDYSAAAAEAAANALAYSNNSESYSYSAQQYYSYSTQLSSWFIGTLDAAPTTRNDGSAIAVGDMYKNSIDDQVYSYNSDGTWTNISYDAATAKEYYEYGVGNYEYISELTAQNYSFGESLSKTPGSGLVGYAPGNNYVYGTVGDKLNRWVDIRDFKDAQAEAGDWSNAIEAAIKYGIENEIHDVRGTGNFYTSRTITLAGMAGSFKVSIDKLGITKDFPNTATSIFGTATDMIRLGTTGNMNGLELYIGTLDGAYQPTTAGVASFDVSVPRTPVANGLVQYGGGLTSSYTTMGYLQNCVVGLLWGDQTSPTGTRFFKIGYVHYNYIGAYIRSGSSGSAPIAEANVFDFRFCAQNYICGVWGGHGGQFTTLQNGNYDYNGQHCARLRLSDVTGLSNIAGLQSLKLTNGTIEYEFLFRYQYQGYWYVFVASYDTDISYTTGNNSFAWTTADTITCTTVDGVALKFDQVKVAQDDASVNRANYFDIFHDYQDDITSKWKIFVEYASGVFGGNLHLSNVSYDTAINPYTHSWYGFGAISVAGTLSFYHHAVSDNPWLNVDGSRVYIGSNMQLSIGLTPILGGANVFTLPRSTGVTDWVSAYTFSDVGTFKLFDEGTHYYVKVTSTYAQASAAFHLVIKGGSCAVFVDYDTHIIAFQIIEVFGADGTTVTGYQLQMRQEAQDNIYVTLNTERI